MSMNDLFGAASAFAMAGWILLAVAFEARQARLASLPHLVLMPILALTFFGPIGLLAFFIARSLQARRLVAVVPA